MKPLLLQECKSSYEFFNRFSATENDINQYIPIILCINYSYGGEYALSHGLFLNNRNNCLYYVEGSECSVWDFNGQFQPQLISYQQLEKYLTDFDLDDDERLFVNQLLSQLPINQNEMDHLNEDYYSYFHSLEISEEYKDILNSISIDKFKNIFDSQLKHIEDNISFYQFNIDYGFPQTFFITLNDKIKLYTTDETNTFSLRFLNDIIGSLEIEENIFHQPSSPKMKV